MIGSIHIIGAGGVGSWLTPSLCLLTSPEKIWLHDGDQLEAKNLNRQLFTPQDIGRNKAEALASKYHCLAVPEYFSFGVMEMNSLDWIIVCADNNPARYAALQECDVNNCFCIIAANEKNSAEAYYYEPGWQQTKLDPRTYYPQIATDRADDPRAQAIGCTGEIQKQSPQLVSANFMAASLAQWLFVLWALEFPKLSPKVIPKLPYKLVANMSSLEQFKVGDALKPVEERTANESTNIPTPSGVRAG